MRPNSCVNSKRWMYLPPAILLPRALQRVHRWYTEMQRQKRPRAADLERWAILLYPHSRRLPLRVAFLLPGEIWAYHVSFFCQSGEGSPFPPGGWLFTRGERTTPLPPPFPFWAKPLSIFGLFTVTTFKRVFACANHSTQS